MGQQAEPSAEPSGWFAERAAQQLQQSVPSPPTGEGAGGVWSWRQVVRSLTCRAGNQDPNATGGGGCWVERGGDLAPSAHAPRDLSWALVSTTTRRTPGSELLLLLLQRSTLGPELSCQSAAVIGMQARPHRAACVCTSADTPPPPSAADLRLCFLWRSLPSSPPLLAEGCGEGMQR